MRLRIKTHIAQLSELHNQPLSRYFNNSLLTACWGKLLTMYSYSTAFDRVDQFPAELAIPTLREYVFTGWVRIKTGVYSYIEKILERFKGDICLNAQIATVQRGTTVKIELLDGTCYQFDQVVFATPPDQVIPLLADPTNAEIRRFSGWHKNQVTTILHTDGSMYDRHQIRCFSEFDFFQTDTGWGYNAYLNQLCGIQSAVSYSLAFHLDHLIHPTNVLHRQDHETPLYTVEAFQYRDEVVATNGMNHTYHAGAYLGDGLHEGAVTSALRVAQLIG
jgi:predicted NAD/FAD-binding protein